MNSKVKAVLASYARSFIVAVLTAYSTGNTDLRDLLTAGLVAVTGPLIRALNAKDPAFGFVADQANTEIVKLLKADKKKAASKKA